ncbi:unnamed protein product [Bemisia tabaci]|uniref:Ionotropic receptor n=1 Tax=Bemisia tabaci TaxID=7038 RepID=A0A9P0EZZ0_BEMTA|nr:unnamed protein product [Bemisia tabaci]
MDFIHCCAITSVLSLCVVPSRNYPSVQREIDLDHFYLKIVQNTLQISESSSVHISNLDAKRSPTQLIRLLHERNISTTIGHLTGGTKTTLVMLSDCEDILSLILGSVSENTRIDHTIESKDLSIDDSVIETVCIEYHEKHRSVRYGKPNKTCDHFVNLREEDLILGSSLPKSTLEQTRGLFRHPVWNAANHLIFIVRDNGLAGPHGTNLSANGDVGKCHLLLTFKFIWRFFRGHKTVACIGFQCFSYDPFRDVINAYVTETSTYFDFTISNLQGTRILVALYDYDGLFEYNFDLKSWTQMATFVLDTAADHLNASKTYRIGSVVVSHFNFNSTQGLFELAIEQDVDLMVYEGGLSDEDFSQFDVVQISEPGSVVFLVPERGLMPAYMIPAKSFTKTVWFSIFGSILLGILTHEVYRRLCITLKSSEENPHPSENISSVLAVYSYILCIGQSRVLTDFSTGKILFMTLSFSFMVLATLFLSVTINNLSIKLRYTPLNTIEEVMESDLLFQSPRGISQKYLFFDDPKFERMREKERTIHTWQDYETERVANSLFLEFSSNNESDVKYGSALGVNISEQSAHDLLNALRGILCNDAFILFLSSLHRQKDLIAIMDPTTMDEVYVDLHIVKEHLMTYPYDMRLLSNSVYGAAIKSVAARIQESGISKKVFEGIIGDLNNHFQRYEEVYDNEPARPFSMVDVSIAFIILIIGLVLSTLVFIGELFWSD